MTSRSLDGLRVLASDSALTLIGAAGNSRAAVVQIPGTKQLWAVGDCSPGLGNRTFVSRRRTGAWHRVTSPTPDASGSFLTGVVAFSQTRAAAVGYRTPAGFRTIALIYR